jgi:2-polyprenyl-6-methoxyphenol hydroxylase-like FAD-dependent oxidoreductase
VQRTILVVGGGIGGLATALTLHDRGLRCRVFEQSSKIRELGVGINTLPHAIGELAALGLLDRLDAVAVRTYELIYMNRFGQEVWRELRGTDAGHPVPQFSIHRGALQGVLRDAVVDRLGPDAISTSHRLAAFEQDEDGVTAHFTDATGAPVETVRGDALIGADGIHSTVRAAFNPGEGPPRWNDADHVAGPGDLVRLPMGKPHGLFNRSGGTVVCFFWVTPTGRLYDLFVAIDALGDKQTPEAVVALAGEHEVEFLPPPSS